MSDFQNLEHILNITYILNTYSILQILHIFNITHILLVSLSFNLLYVITYPSLTTYLPSFRPFLLSFTILVESSIITWCSESSPSTS